MITLPDGRQILWAPDDPVEATILAALASAQQSIHVSMYALTHAGIVSALLAAHARGVDVRLVLDRSQAVESRTAPHVQGIAIAALEDLALGGSTEAAQVQRLRVAGVGMAIGNSSRGSLLHEKACIIDGLTVLSGSVNWSMSAVHYQRNDLRVESNAAVAAGYAAMWQADWERLTAKAPQGAAKGGESWQT